MTFEKSMFIACIFGCSLLNPFSPMAQKVSSGDVSLAESLRTQAASEYYSAVNSVEEYTFDRGNGEMGQPVVTSLGREAVEFIALHDFVNFKYPQFYNQFIELKKFRVYDKSGDKYSLNRQRPGDAGMNSDGVFLDDSRFQYFDITLGKTGQMVQIETEKQYDDSKYLTRIFFHTYYPVKERTLRFIVPQWLQIGFKEVNFEGYKVLKAQEQQNGNTVYTFTMNDLPALKKEYSAIGTAYTYPHIIVMVKSFDYNGVRQNGFLQTADLYKWYNFLYSQCKNDPAPLKPLVDGLVKGKSTDADKVKAIYYWVQDNIRYIAFENGYAGYIPDPVQHVLKDKYGDCKGMANLLTEMLKLAGYDAHFTWIGTRDIPYDHANTPALCVDNHAICTLYLGGKTYFLDATENYIPFGENAYRIQGKSALVQQGEHFEIKYVPVSEKNANKIVTHAKFSIDGNVLKGHVQVTLTGNERTDFHQYYQDIAVDKRPDYLKSVLKFGNDNMTASNITTSDLANRELPVLIEGDIELDNNITASGQDLFASIDFFPKSLSRYAPDEKRQRGYDFESLFTYEDEISLSIPAGKKFIDLPDDVKEEYPGYAFQGGYTVNGNTITLKKMLSIKTSQIKTDDFSNWTLFLKKMKEFNNMQISITKK
ncbi:MAG: transglutaminase-like domain-containing protein [Puia sp.]|nr:transglutaminase-like domain-containing protein [Puia sp.]